MALALLCCGYGISFHLGRICGRAVMPPTLGANKGRAVLWKREGPQVTVIYRLPLASKPTDRDWLFGRSWWICAYSITFVMEEWWTPLDKNLCCPWWHKFSHNHGVATTRYFSFPSVSSYKAMFYGPFGVFHYTCRRTFFFFFFSITVYGVDHSVQAIVIECCTFYHSLVKALKLAACR